MLNGNNTGLAGHDALLAGIRTLIEQTPSALAVLDREARYVSVSKGWLQRFGRGAGAFVGTVAGAGGADHPCGWVAAIEAALQGQAASGMDRGDPGPDDPGRGVFWKVWALDADRGLVAVSLSDAPEAGQGQADDRRYSRQSIHDITSAFGIGVIEQDYATGTTHLSDTCLALIGIGRDRIPTTEQEWMDRFGVRDVVAFRAARAQALDPKGDGIIDFELRPVVDGIERCLRLQTRVVFDGVGAERKPRHAIGLIVDRTADRQMEAALARAQRLETVGRLAGMVAHDFNNILSVILGNLELALPKVCDGDALTLLSHAMDATQMGAGFNKRLLTLAGGHGGVAVRFHLDAHLGQTWEIYRRVLRDDIVLEFQPGSPAAHVFADPAEIDAAILNLVVNARDAQVEGGRIVISTKLVDALDAADAKAGRGEACAYVQITVSDQGPGMPQDVAARAGEPFFTTKPNGIGSGLGLASVIATTQRAGGRFRIDTGHWGTKASMVLPIRDGEATQHVPQDGEIPLGDGEVILVVEDDPLVRETAMQRLEALGYVVSEASNTQSALAQIAEGEAVDLVFSDIVLPGGPSGFEMCATLHKENPKIAVLLTSGHASAAYRSQQDPSALVDILAKPYSLRELAFAVRQSLTAGH